MNTYICFIVSRQQNLDALIAVKIPWICYGESRHSSSLRSFTVTDTLLNKITKAMFLKIILLYFIIFL